MSGDGAIEPPQADSGRRLKLTRVAQVELAFPLDDVTWESAGSGRGRLGVLRFMMHRLLNAAIVGLFANKQMEKLGGDKRNALSYIKEEIDRTETWARENDVGHLKELRIPSSITDKIQTAANDQVAVYYKNRGNGRIPSFGDGAPIMVRDGGWALSLDDEGRFTFAVKLHDGRSSWTRFAVRATKDWHYSLLKRIASDPTVKLGDCKIVRTNKRALAPDGGKKKQKRWMAKLSFTTDDLLPERVADPACMMAINRGRHNFLYAACTTVGRGCIVWHGEDILAAKQKFRALGYARKRTMRVIGAGARAHGKERRYRDYAAVKDAEARFVRTACQRAAAESIRHAQRWRASRILIEDFGKIGDEDLRYIPSWPWYQLKQAIKWAAKKAGLEVIEVPSPYISSKCPRCGNVDTAQHNMTTGVFHCAAEACGFTRDADLVATLNMLDDVRPGCIDSWRKGFEEADKLAKAVRDGAASGGDGDDVGDPVKKGGSRKGARKRKE